MNKYGIPFKFTSGKYWIEIYAPDQATAEAKWQELQDRNYYPTGHVYYTETDSCNPPGNNA